MTNGSGASIFYGGHIEIAQKNGIPVEKIGGTYDMAYTIS